MRLKSQLAFQLQCAQNAQIGNWRSPGFAGTMGYFESDFLFEKVAQALVILGRS